MKRLLAAAACAAMWTTSACDARHSVVAARHQGKATITIQDFGYSGDLTVEPREDVTVLNKDTRAHTLTDKASGLFDTGDIPGGGTGRFVAPTKAGRYPFGCTLHPEMTGVLTVTGG